jgi:hypothetical protein
MHSCHGFVLWMEFWKGILPLFPRDGNPGSNGAMVGWLDGLMVGRFEGWKV